MFFLTYLVPMLYSRQLEATTLWESAILTILNSLLIVSISSDYVEQFNLERFATRFLLILHCFLVLAMRNMGKPTFFTIWRAKMCFGVRHRVLGVGGRVLGAEMGGRGGGEGAVRYSPPLGGGGGALVPQTALQSQVCVLCLLLSS